MRTATIALQDIPQDYKKFDLKDVITEVLTVRVGKEPVKRKASISTAMEREVALDISKSLLSSFSPEMIELCESYHCTKLTTKIKELAKMAGGKIGVRPIYLNDYGKSLKGFEFNNENQYSETFKAKYHICQGSRRDQVIIHFPSFVPDKSFQRSDKVTNFKINACLVALSDFRYDTLEGEYKSLNPELHGKYSSYDSGMLPLLKMPMDPKTSQLCLDQKSVPDNVALVLVMAVSFYTYDHGRFVHLNKEGCMQIKEVY